jgi:hypothetical protein
MSAKLEIQDHSSEIDSAANKPNGFAFAIALGSLIFKIELTYSRFFIQMEITRRNHNNAIM